MNAFVLIIVLTTFTGRGVYVTTQEFDTKEACEMAARVVSRADNSARLACVPKKTT